MIITRTPFRISFFGGGTDYPVWYKEHGGTVLSTSINKYGYTTVRHLPPFFDHKYNIRYRKQEEAKEIEDIIHPSVRECLRYVGEKNGLEVNYSADLPAMSGLGSSSSFTVGFLHALYGLRDQPVSKYQLARDAITVEQERIGENVGSQDQTAAAFGGFNVIEFGGEHEISVSPLLIDPQKLYSLQEHLMLFFTGFQRNASEIAKEQIKNTPRLGRELKVMGGLVKDAVSILTGPKELSDDFGKLLDEGWRIKRSLSSQITNKSVDDMYETARRAGALGGKLLGAGGGGFMLLYVLPADQVKVKEALRGSLHVPFQFENKGSTIIYRMPSESEYV